MKRTFIVMAAFLIVMLGTGLVKSEPVAAQSTLQVTAQIGLNVRTGPGMEYQVITVMPLGTVVTAYEQSGDWVHIDYAGTSGWSHGGWLAASSAAPAAAGTGGSGGATVPSNTCVDNTWGSVSCAPGWIAEAIFSAAATYGVDPWVLMRVAACESHFDPNAIGAAGEIGLFQIFPGEQSEYGIANPWDVWDSANGTARAFSQGKAFRWVCYGRL